MELISIIMPAFNTEKYIARSIKSILSQTYSNFELIIVNDGSTDNTEKKVLIEKEKDSRIKYFEIQNSGSATARNVGLLNSIGEYVVFVDSDDTIEKNMLEILVSKIEEYNCDIVSCSFKKIYKDYNVPEKTYAEEGYYNKRRLEKEIYPILFAHKTLKKGLAPKQMVTKLFRRTLIVKNNIKFSPNLRMGQDTTFSEECMLYADSFYFLPDKFLYNYIFNENSRTQTYLNDAWSIMKKRYEHIKDLMSNFPEYRLEKQLPFALISFSMTAIANISLADNNLSYKMKTKEISNIVNDTDLQNALHKVDTSNFSFLRRIIATLIKRKNVKLIYLSTKFHKRK